MYSCGHLSAWNTYTHLTGCIVLGFKVGRKDCAADRGEIMSGVMRRFMKEEIMDHRFKMIEIKTGNVNKKSGQVEEIDNFFIR